MGRGRGRTEKGAAALAVLPGSFVEGAGPIAHVDLSPSRLFRLIHSGAILLAGWREGKVYGRLDCRSGKRMRPESRVFFASEAHALAAGYRPCAKCMPEAYRAWRAEQAAASPARESSPIS